MVAMFDATDWRMKVDYRSNIGKNDDTLAIAAAILQQYQDNMYQ